MNIEVRWQNGALIPLYPIQFHHQAIVIIVPDEEIADSSPENLFATPNVSAQVKAKANTILAELDAIRSQTINEEERGTPLTEKQQERWKAFEFIRQLRQEQGRII
jgi:hypothetical protein